MSEADQWYWSKRAVEEEQLSQSSANSRARAVHANFALAYRANLAAVEGAISERRSENSSDFVIHLADGLGTS